MELKETIQLPTKYGEFVLKAYADEDSEHMPHLVMYHEEIQVDTPVTVRIHSECLTGDIFGSKRCDCGEQLNQALQIINRERGILIYLRQEGRGIGLLNKMKAYNHQDGGLNTVEANEVLGFKPDERKYDVALQILNDLKVNNINLLTNNPDKLDAFVNSGITVNERLPLIINPNETNKSYLETKESEMGHIFKNI